MDHAQGQRAAYVLTRTREALGLQALQAQAEAGFAGPREMIMAAMACLIQASRKVGEEGGMLELHQAMCAAEVPARVVQ